MVRSVNSALLSAKDKQINLYTALMDTKYFLKNGKYKKSRTLNLQRHSAAGLKFTIPELNYFRFQCETAGSFTMSC